MVDRNTVKQLQSELRNTGKADYKGYTIVMQSNTRYWIGTSTENQNDVVFHTSCSTVAECVKWINAEVELNISQRN